MSKIRTYKELIGLDTFEDRFEYLKMNGTIGVETFGFDRFLNQNFYNSKEWKTVRHEVIVRDNGCDLGVKDFTIHDSITIHHINPILMNDIVDASEYLLNPDYLICTSDKTHKAIHYGAQISTINYKPIERQKYDTCPWKTNN